MAQALVTMPKQARAGELITVRALIAHPMETGYRPDGSGNVLPRNLIRRFVCRYGNEQVFAATLHPSVSANPYLSFTVTATQSATLSFRWEGDLDFRQEEAVELVVS
jgi:sulfur-oxidizing protein SoxZ